MEDWWRRRVTVGVQCPYQIPNFGLKRAVCIKCYQVKNSWILLELESDLGVVGSD